MTPRQRLVQKVRKLNTEKRSLANTLSEIALADEPTDEQRTESRAAQERIVAINNELNKADAAIAELPEERFETVDAETAEYNRLVRNFNIGQVFAAAVEKRATDGEVAELQQHYRIGAHSIPVQVLRGSPPGSRTGDVETRAVTPAPTNTATEQGDIIQPVFAGGVADYLGVYQPIVEAGDAVYPVLKARPTVGGPHTDSTNVAETTGAFDAEQLAPSRLQASFFYLATDAARFPGMGEALRMALSDALSEANDQEIVDQIVADVARTDAGAADDFAKYRSRFLYSQVDGRFATMPSDVRMLVGAATLAHMGGALQANTAVSALDSLSDASGGVRTSALIAAVANSKQDVIVRKGMRRDMVAPIWQGVSLIVDEATKAGTGEIVITARAMSARKVIRAGGFARIQSQHA